jgi:hypothetical protein
MVPALRRAFNDQFTPACYAGYVASLERRCRTHIEFRLSETPCFLPADLVGRLGEAAGEFLRQLLENPVYRQAADGIVPPEFRIPNGERWPTFVQVDFGLLQTANGLEGRLVELQAFPSLYGFQIAMAEAATEAYALEGVTPYLDRFGRDDYVARMRRAIVADHDPAEVVLLEIDPLHQKTLPDFQITEELWGVRAVDVRGVVREGRRLFYDRDGRRTPIARVYNRVIPDELARRRPSLAFDFRDDLDLEWTGGPDWFFRISKFSIPWLRHPWVPRTTYLHEIAAYPADRDAWVLKPLFSFAGGGIIFAPTNEELAAIPPEARALYILQERVSFTPTIDTPYGPTQAEIRIMLVRDEAEPELPRYRALLPLIRMGRGKMMGVDYNKGLLWVGASAGLVAVDGG